MKELQSFLGFANFYRRFIAGYSKVVSGITDLLKGAQAFEWTEAANYAFEDIKKRFTTAPILRHFDPTKRMRLETDASNFGLSGILTQLYEDGHWHPVAFASRKMQPAERN
jgi:hypothetical protein